VQLALLNNRGLQAAYAELGITEAELVQAGRLPNPGFSFGRMTRGDEIELERGLHFNLARLLAHAAGAARRGTPLRAGAQGLVAMQVLSLAADTRKAWVQAVAAEETVRYMPPGDAGGRGRRRTGAAHGAGGQLQQAAAGARAGLLRRRGAEPGPRRAGSSAPRASG
jgi:hypothetical protein